MEAREVTEEEYEALTAKAAERDGECGAILVDGVTCYVEGGAA